MHYNKTARMPIEAFTINHHTCCEKICFVNKNCLLLLFHSGFFSQYLMQKCIQRYIHKIIIMELLLLYYLTI